MDTFGNDVKKYIYSIDWFLVVCTLLCSAYGFILVKSATNRLDTNRYVLVQLAAVAMGIVVMLVIAKFDYDHVLEYSGFIYAGAVVLSAITAIFGTGGEETGNNGWLSFPVIGAFQPAEVVKIMFILTFAKHLDSVRDTINAPKNVLLLAAHAFVIMGLTMLQDDLGMVLVFFFIFAAMCFAAGMSLWYFLSGIFITVILSPYLWEFLGNYQQGRILAGFDPRIDPSGSGFQALRSMFAIGSGGLFGAGFQKGYMTQHPAGLVPAQRTDCIYSVAGEEFGFIGAMLVMVMLGALLIRIFFISRKARNNVGSLICIGIFSMLMIQTVENIGMCLGLLPVVGITLPFFSYGGTSVVGSYVAIGIVLSVSSRRKIYFFSHNEDVLLRDMDLDDDLGDIF